MEEQRRAEQSKDINQLSKINTLNNEERDNESKMSASTFVRKDKKIGRNDPCPCGSGKKYKQCCGKIN